MPPPDLAAGCDSIASEDELKAGFAHPPHGAKPWAYWFWINGNISKEGITADLEALHAKGIGGVLWMEVSGPWWAPQGKVAGLSPEWHDAIQWGVSECSRLGMEFDMTLDFGYGCGGPHITPDISMQKLYWSETRVSGGRPVDQILSRPEVDNTPVDPWLRPGSETLADMIAKVDSYRDIAVYGLPLPTTAEGLQPHAA